MYTWDKTQTHTARRLHNRYGFLTKVTKQEPVIYRIKKGMAMKYPHINAMTEDMLKALPPVEVLQAEIVYAHSEAEFAYDAGSIQLPMTAANGSPVVHGTRRTMDSVMKYWIARRDAAKELLFLAMGIDNARQWLNEKNIPSMVSGKLY